MESYCNDNSLIGEIRRGACKRHKAHLLLHVANDRVKKKKTRRRALKDAVDVKGGLSIAVENAKRPIGKGTNKSVGGKVKLLECRLSYCKDWILSVKVITRELFFPEWSRNMARYILAFQSA